MGKNPGHSLHHASPGRAMLTWGSFLLAGEHPKVSALRGVARRSRHAGTFPRGNAACVGARGGRPPSCPMSECLGELVCCHLPSAGLAPRGTRRCEQRALGSWHGPEWCRGLGGDVSCPGAAQPRFLLVRGSAETPHVGADTFSSTFSAPPIHSKAWMHVAKQLPCAASPNACPSRSPRHHMQPWAQICVQMAEVR